MNQPHLTQIQILFAEEYLSAMDFYFAQRLNHLDTNPSEETALAFALAHRAKRMGHVCYQIGQESRISFKILGKMKEQQLDLPEKSQWMQLLQNSSLISPPDTQAVGHQPMVLDEEGRLYLTRYFDYQKRLANQIQNRLQPYAAITEKDWIIEQLNLFFPIDPKERSPDLQRLATLNSFHHQFSILSGGPGTGKTTTVVKILAIHQLWAEHIKNPFYKITLLAPTGKAAGRMMESIREKITELPLSQAIKNEIPVEAMTIHRALRVDFFQPHHFKHHAKNPLATDLVLVDEASMIDLPLMTKLLEALPQHCKVILLGDREQLASVEAGAMFGDLCNRKEYLGHSQAQQILYQPFVQQELNKQCPPKAGIYDNITHLTKSHRFSSTKGIGQLASAIQAGHAEQALLVLEKDSELTKVSLSDKTYLQQLYHHSEVGYEAYLDAKTYMEALEAMKHFSILCAHRNGPLGSLEINRLLEAYFSEEKKLQINELWYHLRPIMVTTNSPKQGLFNGDVGVIFKDPNTEKPFAYFYRENAEPLKLSPALLPQHETLFAMTTHKSQGSEFDQVLMVLTEHNSQILTRELIYTGITRAKKRVTLFCHDHLLKQAIGTPIHRSSGLKKYLWGLP